MHIYHIYVYTYINIYSVLPNSRRTLFEELKLFFTFRIIFDTTIGTTFPSLNNFCQRLAEHISWFPFLLPGRSCGGVEV